jgi:GT2 family glycosyltransferase
MLLNQTAVRAPLVSVVTPLFNCLAHTQAMVKSLQESMPRGLAYEIILVDDGSTDGTRAWLSGLGEPFRVILNERNLGFGASTNRGAAAARGRVLAFMNNDLLLGPGWLQPMLRNLRLLGGRAGFVGNIQVATATGRVDHSGIVFNLKGKPEHDRSRPGILRRLLWPVKEVAALTGACLIVWRDTWEMLGGFDEGFVNGCEDVDVCLRARKAGLRNVVSLSSSVLHHVSTSPGRKLRDEQNTQRLVLRWRDELAVLASRRWAGIYWRQVMPRPSDFPEDREVVELLMDEFIGALLYAAHLRRTPPPIAVAEMRISIDEELARWRQIFSA